MKLADWARENGISYITAYRWWKNGKLPVPANRTPTGTILVHPQRVVSNNVALYARVSSKDQESDLDRQLSRLVSFANKNGLSVTKSVTEIGSGLNGKRSKLLALLKDSMVAGIVVEHRDKLVRFGFEYIEHALASCGRKLYVVEESELNDDLVQDMVDVLTSFCARLYGRRGAKNKAQRALEATRNEG